MAGSLAFDLDDPKLPKAIKQAAMRSGGYPYDEKLDEDEYDRQLNTLYLQQALMQEHIARHGNRIVIIFEGRDAAGKGGAIRTYLWNVNPALQHERRAAQAVGP